MAYTSTVWSKRQLAVVVRDARIARGLTQAELAQRVGVSRPWISRFESGHVENAGVERIMKLFEVLDMRMEVSYETNQAASRTQNDGDSVSADDARSADGARRADGVGLSRFAGSGGPSSAGVESLREAVSLKKIPGIDDAQLEKMRKRVDQWMQTQLADNALGASMERLAESLKLDIARHDESLSEAVRQITQVTIPATAKTSEAQHESDDSQSGSQQ